jgi:hypothetical protein
MPSSPAADRIVELLFAAFSYDTKAETNPHRIIDPFVSMSVRRIAAMSGLFWP